MEIESTSLIHRDGAKIPRYWWAAIGTYMGSMGIGTAIAYSSTALPGMKQPSSQLLLTSTSLQSWFASILALSALFGGIFAGQSIEKFGRRLTLMLISVPFIAGWLLIAYSTRVDVLLAGRVLTGFASGCCTLACNIYISEIVPTSRRGLIGSGFQLFVAVGIVISYIVGNYVSWPWHAVIATIYPLGMLAIIGALHETPTWLSNNGRHDAAIASYVFFRSTHPESAPIIMKDESTQSDGCLNTFSSYKNPSIYKPFLLCMFLMFAQQFSGINAVTFYTVDIFHSSGSTIDDNLATILIGLIQTVATLIGCILTDRLGRRILLFISGIIMGLALFILTLYYYLSSSQGTSFSQSFGWMPLVALAIYTSAFALGYGPLPWLLMSELLPNQVKGSASGIATAFNWFCCFIVAKEFVPFEDLVGKAGTFGTFGAICIFSAFILGWKLPETKGKSLEEIQRIFSSSYEPKI
ncbi:facilitated trehalose transporter Tret1-like [Panonychus citri]|uniref:facilitated trehalose transporter Tret1-like n=1 Tax=Panonychus citri TaxID=50023 RepID=UPI002307025F|nr:facilitated trehalose transporter Tret1-like [Panonychus citri]